MVMEMSDESEKHKVGRFLRKAEELGRKGDIEDAVRYYTAALYLDQENDFIRKKLYELKKIRFVKFFPHSIALVDDVSYDGKYLPLVFEHNRELIVLDIEAGNEVFRLKGGLMGRAFWFPETHYLGVTLRNGDICVVDVESGNMRRIFNVHDVVSFKYITSVTCSRDCSRVLIALDREKLILVKNPLSKPEFVPIDEEIYCRAVYLRPDGEYVVVLGDEANYVFKLEVDGRLQFIAQFRGRYGEAGSAIWNNSGTHLYMHYYDEVAVINFEKLLEDIRSGYINELWEEYQRRFVDDRYFYNDCYIETRLHIIDFLTEDENELALSGGDEISYHPGDYVVSPDDRYMACIYGRTMIGVWDLKRREVIYKWRMRKTIKDQEERLDAVRELSWLGNDKLVIVWLDAVAVLDLEIR